MDEFAAIDSSSEAKRSIAKLDEANSSGEFAVAIDFFMRTRYFREAARDAFFVRVAFRRTGTSGARCQSNAEKASRSHRFAVSCWI
jgi:hypothetical protein